MIAFEWDPRKAAANARKHGIQFADAVPVLEDEFAISLRDDVQAEERWVTIGMDALARILTSCMRGVATPSGSSRRAPLPRKNVGSIWRDHETGIRFQQG